jgi:RimJ/RimL family protein N-acetyltransferase
MSIALRPLNESDLPVLERWLAATHVVRWWQAEWSVPVVTALRGGEGLPETLRARIAEHDGRPIGYIQLYNALADPSGFWDGIENVTNKTWGIDMLIGEAEMINRKFGREMARQVIVELFAETDADRVVSDPHRDNWPCIIALKRIGFRERGRFNKPGVNGMHLTLARGVFKG